MKKIITLLLSCVLMITSLGLTAFATGPGDGNITGGGGNMGDGSSQYYWNPGDDGVRITVIDAKTGEQVAPPIDFARISQPANIIHFGSNSKLDYRSGTSLSPATGIPYVYDIPAETLPLIIPSSGGGGNITEIKKYFCSEYAALLVADATGTTLDDFLAGKYKLFIEPVAYFFYGGQKYAFTATEVALYDILVNGKMRSNMLSLSHKNLPLSMYLEKRDDLLMYEAWTGSASASVSNEIIIAYLGLGIVSYLDVEVPPEGNIETPDYEYRVNTEVITSITLDTTSDITPDNPLRVTFNINGRNYNVSNIVIPENNSQIVWVKWRTPLTPQTIEIDVSVSGAYRANDTLIAKIVDLNENIPPDPTATDTAPNGYSIPSLPNNPQKLSSSWGIWSSYWQPNWVWRSDWNWVSDGQGGGHWEDDGEYVDRGWWEYTLTSYRASLTADKSVTPDDKVPTASGKDMKSGYGIKETVTASVSTNAPIGHYTYTQTAVAYFPEFSYNTYWRLLDLTSKGLTSSLEFKENEYSTYSRRVHFTPLWFPDNEKYTVSTYVIDTWTPAGMLSVTLSDYVNIEDNMFDDWYTNRE